MVVKKNNKSLESCLYLVQLGKKSKIFQINKIKHRRLNENLHI